MDNVEYVCDPKMIEDIVKLIGVDAPRYFREIAVKCYTVGYHRGKTVSDNLLDYCRTANC